MGAVATGCIGVGAGSWSRVLGTTGGREGGGIASSSRMMSQSGKRRFCNETVENYVSKTPC